MQTSLYQMSVEILFLAFFSSVLHCKETEAGDSEGELPFDLNADSDQMKEDGLAYGQSLAMRTLGFGIGCSLVLGFVNFFCLLGVLLPGYMLSMLCGTTRKAE
mmetsp:Transcript_22615/g.29357  ORF Transcript_22615/g.29357 Transcript_22615/m.29357 type:complete len:103 (-) Transcript_22615:2578-2886(-)